MYLVSGVPTLPRYIFERSETSLKGSFLRSENGGGGASLKSVPRVWRPHVSQVHRWEEPIIIKWERFFETKIEEAEQVLKGDNEGGGSNLKSVLRVWCPHVSQVHF